MHLEAYGSRCKPQLVIVGCDDESFELFACKECAGKMDGIEGAKQCWEWLRSTIEDCPIKGDQIEGFDHLKNGGAWLCDGLIFEPEPYPRTVDRTKALEPYKLTRHRSGDLWPKGQAGRFLQNNAEQYRGVNVHVHRCCRSSSRISVELIRHLAGV